jgi:6-methylsalicylate decarboxylase
MPYLIDRATGLLPHSFLKEKPRSEYREDARRFYFDTALPSSNMHMAALRELLKDGAEDHLLFGSDFPNAPREGIIEYTVQLESSKLVDAATLRTNALKLFPRLRVNEE